MVNPEIVALWRKAEAHDEAIATQAREIAELRGSIQQLNKTVRAAFRQAIWQLIVLVVSLCGVTIGGVIYQTNRIEKRFDQIETRLAHGAGVLEKSFDNVEKRLELFDKNINARFEDLKQEVRAQRK